MRQPSLMAVTAALSLTALFFSLGGAGLAANGAAFVLGVINSATAPTALVANFNGSTVQVNNTSAGASAVPLQLTAAAGHPPMKVNTANKVINLNADYLDGIDSSGLTRVRRVPFTVGPSATSASIVLPANLPVHVMGTDGFCVGGATMFSKNGTVTWADADSCNGDNGAPRGSGSDVGHFIFFIVNTGGSGCPCGLLAEVAAGGAIRLRNTNGANSYSGVLTLVW